MPTLHSTPTTTMIDQPSHPIGFNNQTYYDPFIPSNNSEESLIPVQSDHSPAHQSYNSPSPPHTLTSHDGTTRLTTGQTQYTNPPQVSLSNGYSHSPPPNSQTEDDGGNAPYGFLSPNPYPSENGYNASSEHTATPDYDPFFLGDDLDMLDDPSQEDALNDPPTFDQYNLDQTHAHIDSPPRDYAHRASVGTATLSSSHLMSPALTDAPETSTRAGTATPQDQRKEDMVAGAPPNDQANALHQPYQLGDQMQETPIDTSNGTSPEMLRATPNIACAASPVIRVERYARGDSPARLPGQGDGTKRNRAGSRSSHLAVQDADGLSEGVEDGERYHQRTALDPDARSRLSTVEVPNLKDQEDSAHRALKNADVEDWLDRSASGSEAGADVDPEKPKQIRERQRARSVGAQALSHANLETLKTRPLDSHIPGPGVLIDESSGDEESEDEEIASIEDSPIATPTEGMNDIPGEARPGVYDELPNQPPLYRAKLWQDQVYDSSDPGVKMQPITSNDAIMRFQQRAGDIETLSRVATWGTRRRSESDMQSLFSRLTFTSTQSAEFDTPRRERSGSFLQQAAAKLVPRRAPTFRRKGSEKSKPEGATRPVLGDHSRTSSGENRKESGLTVPQAAPKAIQRMGSLGKKPKSPRINTGSAVAAMAGQMAALGSSGPLSATAASSPPRPWNATKSVAKRSRSRSDLNNASPASTSATELGGLADLWTKQGGPPMPALVAPKTEEPAHGSGYDDDDDDDAIDRHGVTMDLSIKFDSIVPTLEGFKANVRQLNPRLPPFMFDRIAQEQLRRFKKLMDLKIKHVQAVNMRRCLSGKHCTELGGQPTYPPFKSSKDAEQSHASFSVAGLGPSDDDNALADGIVTPALFPPGVPMPPVKRLPAEFECSLCFKVKKFQKPSDWSKHVHEDVQPFTCTFPTCAEPKSFKRKADWVRHENERHRQLEWWQCNMNDCNHRCYRKDNFVQHLVREHKLPEPKVKTAKAGKPAVRGPSSQKARNNKHSDTGDESYDEIDQVWKLVEECRREAPKNPKDEACKFCGNVCNSWKKLTVHLAKHMEQISMPVLGVVKQQEVTADTIISPIEQRILSQAPSMSPISQGAPDSPFGVSRVKMTKIPGGFTTLPPQPGHFNGTSRSQYQRVSSNTYPPPAHQLQLAPSYNQGRGTPNLVSEHGHCSNSPTSQFNPIDGHRAFNAQASSPEDVYGSTRVPTSQTQCPPYNGHGAIQYLSQPQQQAFGLMEGSIYQYNSTTSASYPQQQQATPPTPYQQQSQMGTPGSTFPQQEQMGGQIGIEFGMGQMQGALGNGGRNGYGQSGPTAFAYQQ
ncbi:MAG: hypothetical protein Q9217_004619 [Psora testacea]